MFLERAVWERQRSLPMWALPSGSWGHVYHDFAAIHGQALFNSGVPFETAPNDAIISGTIDLNEYEAVIWIAGDESTADETFNSTEQSAITAYLKQGGKLFVSGSEIGWDLDNKGSTQDKNFYNSILKADYKADDAAVFAEYVKKPSEGTTLVLLVRGKLDKRGKFYKTFAESDCIFVH